MSSGVYPKEKRRGLFQKGHANLTTGRTWIKPGQKIRLGAKHTAESKAKMALAKRGLFQTILNYSELILDQKVKIVLPGRVVLLMKASSGGDE